MSLHLDKTAPFFGLVVGVLLLRESHVVYQFLRAVNGKSGRGVGRLGCTVAFRMAILCLSNLNKPCPKEAIGWGHWHTWGGHAQCIFQT